MPLRAKRPSLPSLTDASSSSSSSSFPPQPIDEHHEQHHAKVDEEHPHWPPPDPREENAAEKQTRLECERAAKAVSDEIDRAIEHDRQERKKLTSEVKIILLGQAESGKSTILRNFQLQFTPTAFKAEVAAWRVVIDLNLVRSVTYILNILVEPSASPSSPSQYAPHSDDEERLTPLEEVSPELRRLRISLSPLRGVEEVLRRFLSAEEHGGGGGGSVPHLKDRAFEVSVRSGSKWKSLFGKGGNAHGAGPGAARGGRGQGQEELENARRVIEACREDMMALWAHPTVRQSLTAQRVSLEFHSGFFLDEVERIAAPGYEPTSEDVLKARIQTMGVEEHILHMETIKAGPRWAIYDVGGSRAQRAAWVPFFDDVNLLIFLAPVSAFNQTLSEDRKVNRLWDSIYLWKTICMNKLLAGVDLVLLLNKIDILDAKLKSGIDFGTFVTSYREKPNDLESVMTYLKSKFLMIHKQYSKRDRAFHVHFTCATDPRATSIVLARIQEAIFKKNIESADFL
ncbi:G-alpha-domain-containing protein [Dentipellis sp. KUC8613]|nr:G-alpha-domain-containing protein [Dentipellis sp. KUC8613]